MKIHIVQKGDTLWEIAKNYGVDFEELKQINSHISSPDMIMPGMKIKIPSSAKAVVKESAVKEKKMEKEMKVAPSQPLPPKKKEEEKSMEIPMPQMPVLGVQMEVPAKSKTYEGAPYLQGKEIQEVSDYSEMEQVEMGKTQNTMPQAHMPTPPMHHPMNQPMPCHCCCHHMNPIRGGGLFFASQPIPTAQPMMPFQMEDQHHFMPTPFPLPPLTTNNYWQGYAEERVPSPLQQQFDSNVAYSNQTIVPEDNNQMPTLSHQTDNLNKDYYPKPPQFPQISNNEHGQE